MQNTSTMRMTKLLRRILPLLAAALATALCSCSSTQSVANNARMAHKGDVIRVRTTAYTHNEADHLKYGKKNAVGTTLRDSGIKSAAADWSRIPYGTKFKVIQTGDVYMVDDYGSALVGTNTIDLYKPSFRAMNAWGVKHVDIKILKIGSYAQSAQILAPRRKHGHVDKMARVMENRGHPSKMLAMSDATAPANRRQSNKPAPVTQRRAPGPATLAPAGTAGASSGVAVTGSHRVDGLAASRGPQRPANSSM